ncbi:hypothetical protein RFI_13713 [Reticulomyxa filosa]|uniref:Uncharacterized protein n=1 Tax=Reticulomyxa filosa TaxID=46433 RepID=X6NC50_RETFI|nr:hypothetical protein RFI_13713 [Reticulomyxa filosa]|eukprot:ETO23468.1 hypothetical protein RFI_13713 [Reticulomyxa filosa]
MESMTDAKESQWTAPDQLQYPYNFTSKNFEKCSEPSRTVLPYIESVENKWRWCGDWECSNWKGGSSFEPVYREYEPPGHRVRQRVWKRFRVRAIEREKQTKYVIEHQVRFDSDFWTPPIVESNPPHYVDEYGNEKYTPSVFDGMELKTTKWQVVVDITTDEEGWQYSTGITFFFFFKKKKVVLKN